MISKGELPNATTNAGPRRRPEAVRKSITSLDDEFVDGDNEDLPFDQVACSLSSTHG